MKDITTLKDLMVLHLQSLYDAEIKWAESLRENSTLVSSNELKYIFDKGSKNAYQHANLLKDTLSNLGKSIIGKRNNVANDITKELKELKETAADHEVLDAGLIVTHQCMNHYMIAKYGTVSSYARMLSEEKIARILHEILEEEKREDEALTKLAEEKINVKAKSALIH